MHTFHVYINRKISISISIFISISIYIIYIISILIKSQGPGPIASTSRIPTPSSKHHSFWVSQCPTAVNFAYLEQLIFWNSKVTRKYRYSVWMYHCLFDVFWCILKEKQLFGLFETQLEFRHLLPRIWHLFDMSCSVLYVFCTCAVSRIRSIWTWLFHADDGIFGGVSRRFLSASW